MDYEVLSAHIEKAKELWHLLQEAEVKEVKTNRRTGGSVSIHSLAVELAAGEFSLEATNFGNQNPWNSISLLNGQYRTRDSCSIFPRGSLSPPWLLHSLSHSSMGVTASLLACNNSHIEQQNINLWKTGSPWWVYILPNTCTIWHGCSKSVRYKSYLEANRKKIKVIILLLAFLMVLLLVIYAIASLLKE